MPTNAEYQARIQLLDWAGLRDLWNKIKVSDAPEWAPGKAFEYLVLRMFDLDECNVKWPYTVTFSGGQVIEEIDGSIRVNGLYCLVESKDEVVTNSPILQCYCRNSQCRRRSSSGPVIKLRKHSKTRRSPHSWSRNFECVWMKG